LTSVSVNNPNPAIRYGCTVCSYEYDPARGDLLHGIMPGVPFDELPADWRCPWCGANKEAFTAEE
jgi:rubredoxin